MTEKCLCQSPNKTLLNTHYRKGKYTLSLIGNGDDKGIVIFDHGIAIATFDIKYCPMCGKHLSIISLT